jgi:Cellulose binding domain
MFSWFGRRAMVAVLAGAAAAVVPASAAHAAVNCEVTYRTASWSNGFIDTVQIKNLGDTWNGYAFQLTLRGDETVTAASNHSFVQGAAGAVTFNSREGARPVPAGGTVWFSFFGRHTGVHNQPTGPRINGAYCTLVGHPYVIVEPDGPISYSEGGGPMQFTMRLSQPPPQQQLAQVAFGGGPPFAVQPVLRYFTPQNWNTPQNFLMMPISDDLNTVNDRTVITVSTEGYIPDTLILNQIDKG